MKIVSIILSDVWCDSSLIRYENGYDVARRYVIFAAPTNRSAFGNHPNGKIAKQLFDLQRRSVPFFPNVNSP